MSSLDQRVIDSVREILDPLLLQEGLELVDIEYRREGRGWVLRIYIDKEGGVSVEDCARISRELGNLLDLNDIIPGTYNLEISSPGLTRALKKVRDFESFKGKLVKIKTMTDIQGRRVFIGRLIDFVGNVASVEMDGHVYFIPYDEIERANLELDF
ncbi:MAG TPA: ribosome maturation factor RimP [Thermodesulfobacteriota bacterium]|nr:ribosome maturation factor RimP [Thermodesulfobacteriota bacterium]